MKKWRIIQISILIGLLVGVVFIGQGAKRKVLNVWTGYSEMVPVYKAAASDFEAEHPGVDVKVSSFPLREEERKLAAALPAGQAPDVFSQGPSFMYRYWKAGMVSEVPEDIQSLVEKTTFPQYLPRVKREGEIFYVPTLVGTKILYWNKKMFREAGLPGPPKTLDEVKEYAQKLAKYDEQGNLIRSGISLRLTGGGSGIAEKWWHQALLPYGGRVLEKTPEGKWHAGYNNEAGRKALKFYIDLLYKYKVDSYRVKHDAEAFAQGKTAMFERETWVIGYMKKNAPDVEYGTAPLPGAKQRGTLAVIYGLWVPKSSKHKDLAWEFVKHFYGKKYQEKMVLDVGWQSARKDLNYDRIFEEVPQLKAAFTFPKGYKVEYYELGVPPSDEIYTKLATALRDAFKDKDLLDNPEGVVKVIEKAAKETNDILKEAGLYGE